MKRMMFNDRFGLMDAVIEKRKTVTRRLVKPQPDRARCWNPILVKDERMYYRDERGMCQLLDENGRGIYPLYKVGEIVAIAQSYFDIWSNLVDIGDSYTYHGCKDGFINAINYHYKGIHHSQLSGWTNKMFVRADLMPHQIRVLDIRAERLQDITDEDCLMEGIIKYTKDKTVYKYDLDDGSEMFSWRDLKRTPQEAFATLIDKISGRGIWDANPWVWRIEFELVK